jgi:hypothetical protein
VGYESKVAPDPLSGIRNPGGRDPVYPVFIRVIPWAIRVYPCFSVGSGSVVRDPTRGQELWPARDRICAFCRFCTSSDNTRIFKSNPLFSIR